mmetsp:Transcript_14873/g.31300  ORF Transcript_14873/g.31300 Transcript_14873/m.31300 type:complete len:82 (-) Transcript_14873:359-604(-)
MDFGLEVAQSEGTITFFSTRPRKVDFITKNLSALRSPPTFFRALPSDIVCMHRKKKHKLVAYSRNSLLCIEARHDDGLCNR